MKRMKLTRMALLTLITLTVIVSALIVAQTEISLADEGEVTYLDHNGYRQKLWPSEYTKLTNKKYDSLGEGWYVVKGNVTISGKVLVTSRAKLVLCTAEVSREPHSASLRPSAVHTSTGRIHLRRCPPGFDPPML